MSVSYLVGFRVRPPIESLDAFFEQEGFAAEPPGRRKAPYTRVYVNGAHEREIAFFYRATAKRENRGFFGPDGWSIHAFGELRTFGTCNPAVVAQDRERAGLDDTVMPTRQRHEDVARALKETFRALVVSEQAGARL